MPDDIGHPLPAGRLEAEIGVRLPLAHHHPLVHGDDLVMEGRRKDLEGMIEICRGRYEIKSSIACMDGDLDIRRLQMRCTRLVTSESLEDLPHG